MARLRMQQANNSMIVPCDRRRIDLSNYNSGNEDDSDESDESSRTRGVWDDEYNASDMEGIDPYYFFDIGVDEEIMHLILKELICHDNSIYGIKFRIKRHWR